MGCYIAPYDAYTINTSIMYISQQLRRAELLGAINFNDDLAAPEGNSRDEAIAVALATAGF